MLMDKFILLWETFLIHTIACPEHVYSNRTDNVGEYTASYCDFSFTK